MNGKPREAVVKSMKLIAMEFDDMVIDQDAVEAWDELLSDIPDDLLLAAVKVSILKATYRPRIAEIRHMALSLMKPETEIDAGRAWELVLKAVRTYGKPRTAQALASLPPFIADVTRRVGFSDICDSEEIGVIRGQFMKIFEAAKDREKEVGILPPALQTRFRQAALESQPESLGQILGTSEPKKIALPSVSGRVTGYTPPQKQNVVPFRRKPQARTPEELRQQAELLKSETTKTAEHAEFSAMTTEERAEYLKQQAQQLGGAA